MARKQGEERRGKEGGLVRKQGEEKGLGREQWKKIGEKSGKGRGEGECE